jgi:hypothetical protein
MYESRGSLCILFSLLSGIITTPSLLKFLFVAVGYDQKTVFWLWLLRLDTNFCDIRRVGFGREKMTGFRPRE